MASPAQIAANRKNAKLSTGPKSGTERTRFNGLKHGLRAEQVVLPGESHEEFEAERQAWLDDWKPQSHTRAVLVERAAVASWKLRRATRCESVRLYEVAADAAHEFDLAQKERVEGALDRLSWDPGASLAQLRCEAAGIDRLVGLWEGLVAAASAPGGWDSRSEHHDRLLNLLGHPSGSEPKDLEIGRVSVALLAGDDPAAASELRAFCADQIAGLRRERQGFWEPAEFRRRMIDLALAAPSKEALLLHRYEMAHEKSLRASIRGLLTLEKSGADLPDEPEAETESPAGPDRAEGNDAKSASTSTCTKLASVGAPAPSGARPGTSAGPTGRRGRRNRPVGADPGPESAPKRS